MVLYGSGEDEITFTYDDGVRHYSTSKPFEGVINNIERRWRETEVRLGHRGAVALPVRAVLRGVQGLSPEAAGARGEDRRPAYRPGHRDVDPRGGRLVRGAARHPHAEAERDRRSASSRRSGSGSTSSTMSGSITSRCRAPQARCPAARASASASPRRSAPASPACSTCWTSPRSACISATMRGCWKR